MVYVEVLKQETANLMAYIAETVEDGVKTVKEMNGEETSIYLSGKREICIIPGERPEGIKFIHLEVSSKEELEIKHKILLDKQNEHIPYPDIVVEDINDYSKDYGFPYFAFNVYVGGLSDGGWGYEVRYRTW